MISPGCRITRHSTLAELLPNLSAVAANALSEALSMAREALFSLRSLCLGAHVTGNEDHSPDRDAHLVARIVR